MGLRSVRPIANKSFVVIGTSRRLIYLSLANAFSLSLSLVPSVLIAGRAFGLVYIEAKV